MLITTILLTLVMRQLWRWTRFHVTCIAGPLLLVDLMFWGSSMLKVPHGGWFPLLAAFLIYLVMSTWRKGRKLLYERLRSRTLALDLFVQSAFEQGHNPKRVPGAAVFLSGTPDIAPVVLLHNLKYNKIVHEKTVILSFVVEESSHVPEEDRVDVKDLGHGFFSVVARYGFMESPHILDVIELASAKGVQFERRTTGFYLGRESIILGKARAMPRWRALLFATMARLAQGPSGFFGIPPNQVVELGVQIEL